MVTFVGAGIGSYFGGYLKIKGENLAQKEDVTDIKNQVAAVTQTTKRIEAEISGELWDKQKRWELTRDTLCDVIKKVSIAQDTLPKFFSAFRLHQEGEIPKGLLLDPAQQWSIALAELASSVAVVSVVCDDYIHEKIIRFSALLHNIGSEIASGRLEAYDANLVTLGFVEVTDAIRQGLKVVPPRKQLDQAQS